MTAASRGHHDGVVVEERQHFAVLRRTWSSPFDCIALGPECRRHPDQQVEMGVRRAELLQVLRMSPGSSRQVSSSGRTADRRGRRGLSRTASRLAANRIRNRVWARMRDSIGSSWQSRESGLCGWRVKADGAGLPVSPDPCRLLRRYGFVLGYQRLPAHSRAAAPRLPQNAHFQQRAAAMTSPAPQTRSSSSPEAWCPA